MTKSLQEIQKENRKFILEAIYGCSYEEAFTLSRVLLAFKNKDVKIYNKSLVDWDLTKETLEEQSEETQRGINKLFNN